MKRNEGYRYRILFLNLYKETDIDFMSPYMSRINLIMWILDNDLLSRKLLTQ